MSGHFFLNSFSAAVGHIDGESSIYSELLIWRRMGVFQKYVNGFHHQFRQLHTKPHAD